MTQLLPPVLNIKEVAVALRVGKNTAYGLVRSGRLKGVRVGRQIRVSRAELSRYLGIEMRQ